MMTTSAATPATSSVVFDVDAADPPSPAAGLAPVVAAGADTDGAALGSAAASVSTVYPTGP